MARGDGGDGRTPGIERAGEGGAGGTYADKADTTEGGERDIAGHGVPLARWRVRALVQVVFEDAAGLRVAQLADGALFDLAHALASDLELLADLFEGVVVVVYQPEAQLDHLALAQGQVAEHLADLVAQQGAVGGLGGAGGLWVFDDVGERVFLFI